MTTYAEKADISAKAVKVLDSVTMNRHKASAKNYAQIARKKLLKCKDEHVSGFLYGFKRKASPLIEQIDMALESMLKRLDKPRYVYRNGEWCLWVRKLKPDQCGLGLNTGLGRNNYMMTQKEAIALRNLQMKEMAKNTAMASQPFYGQHNALVGSARFDRRGQ